MSLTFKNIHNHFAHVQHQDASGPFHPDSNSNGQGDTVSNYVDFTPLLLDSVSISHRYQVFANGNI